MKTIYVSSLLAIALAAGPALAQTPAPAAPAAPAAAPAQPAPGSVPFAAGQPLPVRDNIKTFGSFCGAESVTYDPDRDLYIVVSPCTANAQRPNDGYISLVNPDGTVHTLKWIQASEPMGVTLNDPRGSDIGGGKLYVADIDTVRWFDLATGAPQGSVTVEGALFLNDLEVAEDGTVYVSDSGNNDDPGAIIAIAPDGTYSDLVRGAPLARPNGVAIDPEGNIVSVQLGSTDVLSFSPAGELVKTESNLEALNDGLVILEDGTKYTSSLRANHVVRIPPGGTAEIVAEQIFTPASIGYDSKRNRIVVPENQQNAITLIDLQ